MFTLILLRFYVHFLITIRVISLATSVFPKSHLSSSTFIVVIYIAAYSLLDFVIYIKVLFYHYFLLTVSLPLCKNLFYLIDFIRLLLFVCLVLEDLVEYGSFCIHLMMILGIGQETLMCRRC